MIHFTCEHCRKSVHVDDRHGGMKGRCPHCKQTVAIPAANDALSALAAAFGQAQAKPDDTNHAGVPPPPGVGQEPLREELIILPGESNADLADTVMLPAGVFAEKEGEEEPTQARSRRPVYPTALDRHRPALNIVRTILILVAVIVVLIVAVVGFALATRKF
jgi:phage FluMu protein Com